MEDDDKERIDRAVRKLLDRDKYLLVNNATERSITHKLALYLQEEYQDNDVDCEYNLNVTNESHRKVVYFIEEEYKRVKKKLKKKRKKTKNIEGVEHLEVSVFPDIIIHHRGKNQGNRIIFEVKKSNNLEEIAYDRLKLQRYTHRDSEFKYIAGLFIIFFVAEDYKNVCQLEEYSDGQKLSDLTISSA